MAEENKGYRSTPRTDEINYVLLEEQLNNLLADPSIRATRTASADYVIDKLRERMKSRNAKVLNQASLLDKQELCRLVKQNMQNIGLSQRMFREFKNRAYGKEGTEEAIAFLEDALLEKEIIQFRKDANIAAKVWQNFRYSRIYTDKATLQKICRQLELNPEEVEAFNRTIVASVFDVNRPLREDAHKLQKQTRMSVLDFLIYACVSTDAWESFYPIPKNDEDNPKEANPARKTSKKTLLKLIIGFGIDENRAKDFLANVNSTFVIRLDLIFLAAIRCGYNHPIKMQEILDFFLEDRCGESYSQNPYN